MLKGSESMHLFTPDQEDHKDIDQNFIGSTNSQRQSHSLFSPDIILLFLLLIFLLDKNGKNE